MFSKKEEEVMNTLTICHICVYCLYSRHHLFFNTSVVVIHITYIDMYIYFFCWLKNIIILEKKLHLSRKNIILENDDYIVQNTVVITLFFFFNISVVVIHITYIDIYISFVDWKKMSIYLEKNLYSSRKKYSFREWWL